MKMLTLQYLIFLRENITLYMLMISDKSLHIISTQKNVMCDILQAKM